VAARVQAWLERGWYRGGAAGWLLAPLAWLFGAVVSLRRLAYRRDWFHVVRVPRPVIVIGNLSVGGSGKTPLTAWLAGALAARGLRVGIVSRGYGGTARGPVRAGPDADPAAVGDEPVLLAARTGAAVAVARDRVAAARSLVDEVDVLLADDGLQHYRLGRDLELLVVDGARGYGNGRLLPAGPLREPRERARRVGAVVENLGAGVAGRPPERRSDAPALRPRGRGGRGFLPAREREEDLPPVLAMRLVPGDVVGLADGRREPLAAWAGRRVHAVAGIGDPGRFFATLAAAGLEPVPHPFPDHARYAAADLAFADDLPVLMTEKDAVKCRAFAGARHHYLEVAAQFDDADAERLLELALGVLHRPRR
jgi:tetraacyldisaccharide 4'-kinase